MKPTVPRIRKQAGLWWACFGDGICGYGLTPAACYQDWLNGKTLAMSIIERQANGLPNN